MKYGFFACLLSLVAFSCTTSTGESNVTVKSAKDIKAPAETNYNYSLLLEESRVTWIGSKPAGKHYGTIRFNTGKFVVEDNTIAAAKVNIDINTIICEDLEENPERHDRLINHLKSDDFFDAENYPEAQFEIAEIAPYDGNFTPEQKDEFATEYAPASALEHVVGNPTHIITGNLTMRDTTLSISFPAALRFKQDTVIAKAKFNIDRTNWNLKYRDEASVADKTKDRFIYNTVNIGFDMTAVKN